MEIAATKAGKRNTFQLDDSYRTIIGLAVPVVLGQLAHFILNFADRYFIARLGINEAAGASLCTSLMWICLSFTSLVSGGTIALVARKIGERNINEANAGSEQSIFIAFIIGIWLSLGGYYFSGDILSLFRAAPNVTKYGLDYFRVIICCFPMLILSQTIWAVFQAAGDTKTPMIVFTGMSIINFVIDPILIFDSFTVFNVTVSGYGLGVRGAAFATVIAEAYAIIWMFLELHRFGRIQVRAFWRIAPDFRMIRRILRIGFWTGINSFSRPLSVAVIQRILAFHGTRSIVAFIFGLQWIALIFLFFEGLRVAVATIVGRSLGKRDVQAAEETIFSGALIGYGFVIIFMVMGFLFAGKAIRVFSADAHIILIGSGYLKIVLIGMIFSVPMTVYSAAFNGAGDTMPPVIISFISNWLGKVGIAALFSFYFGYGVNGVWVAIALSIFLEGAGVYLWFKRGSWKKKKI